MSLTHWHGNSTRALGAVLIIGALACAVLAETPAADTPTATTWTVLRPAASQHLPLARLVRNPDESNGGPKYGLADQTGAIQRYVEPAPGIDLEPYVGYAVKVRHDTGRTLLASQLELPGQEKESILEVPDAGGSAASTGVDSVLRGILDGPGAMTARSDDSICKNPASPVQPAQYMQGQQYVQGPSTPVVIQEAMPQGMQSMQGEMPPMMGPQGMVTYDPADASILGAPMGAYPPGAG